MTTPAGTYDRAKRLLDATIALLVLILTAPLLLTVAVTAWIVQGRPILFRQVRPGRYGVAFQIVKFRTMERAAAPGAGDGDDLTRTTPLGRWLRATSLDELPNLWNVIRGEMSLVGPRPLLFDYLDVYTPEQARRHDVLPGVTGLAQVRGRNALSWEERLAYDVSYVEHRSLRLDLAILAQTARRVWQPGIAPAPRAVEVTAGCFRRRR